MSQNRNTPYHWEYSLPNFQQMGAGISVFNLQDAEQDLLKQNEIQRRNAFSEFLTSRNQYLGTLSYLGDNWISGSAKQPSEQSILLSKELLSNLGNWYTSTGFAKFVYPKILMSPTPSGGISMEIELFPDLRAYVSILDETINYEVEKDGFYLEFEADKNNISNQLLNLYSTNERGYNP